MVLGIKKRKGIVRASSRNKKGKGIVRAGYGNKMDFKCCLILSQTFKYKSIIRMNLDLMVFILEIICLKIKDGAYVINLDEYADVGTH